MKKSEMHYAAAIQHREYPGVFLACFAPAGHKVGAFVTENGRHKMFTNEIEAELAAHRALVDALNRAVVKSARDRADRRIVSAPSPSSEADAVFSRFRN